MGGRPSFPVVSLPRDKVVIVTGGNTGIGYETAKWIAIMGAHVIIACRSKERAKQAIERMNEEFRMERRSNTENVQMHETLHVEDMSLDLASFSSVMKFINDFKKSGRKLHGLVCNGGVAMHSQEYTEDDNELMFQVNYLSHFLIIAHLLPIMLISGDDCRIVLNSSVAHRVCSFDIDTIQGKHLTPDKFGRLEYYGRSKLYQIMLMFCMNRRLKNTNVTVTSLHPGHVDSEITRSFNDWSFFFSYWNCLKKCGILKTPYQAATTVINAVVNPSLSGVRDVYFVACKPSFTTPTCRNKRYQEHLWAYTLVRLKDYLTDELIEVLEGRSTFL